MPLNITGEDIHFVKPQNFQGADNVSYVIQKYSYMDIGTELDFADERFQRRRELVEKSFGMAMVIDRNCKLLQLRQQFPDAVTRSKLSLVSWRHYKWPLVTIFRNIPTNCSSVSQSFRGK